MADRTVLDLYRHDVDAPRTNHYSHWTPAGRRSLTTGEFFRRTCALADALAGLGVGPGDRVMLLSDDRPEWHMVDLAVLDLHAVDVPVYGTLTAGADRLPGQGLRRRRLAVAENPDQMAQVPGDPRPLPDARAPDPDRGRPRAGSPRLQRARGHRARRLRAALLGPRSRRRRALADDHHLHLGHHRRAQGRDAEPPQPGLERPPYGAPGGCQPQRPRPRVPAAVPRARANGRLLLHVVRNLQGLLLGAPRGRPHRLHPADRLHRRAEVLREGPAEDPRQRRCGAAGEAAPCSTGRSGSAARRPCGGSPAASSAARSAWSTASPTSWCCRRSGRASAGGCASRSPAAPRCRSTSPSSSTRSASGSWRAMD